MIKKAGKIGHTGAYHLSALANCTGKVIKSENCWTFISNFNFIFPFRFRLIIIRDIFALSLGEGEFLYGKMVGGARRIFWGLKFQFLVSLRGCFCFLLFFFGFKFETYHGIF